ncbi:ATP-dependent DNA ligase [Streptomyces dangxiongensis]|uniref:ATP-dependent DNA ligase n=1 Tax=Streptomyces dangxiongensis TaxID=1442032 RepID=A0A3G2JLH8_9ACTN|nr:ATP-dependent DNA ligase [Streptomyces dangxiongensis]AYN43288.1 ATP-dependent DNA ligase [Streptomyces dangxiongensis]
MPDVTAPDGELVAREAAGRLAFEQLQNRLQRRGARAARAADEWPAHFVAVDLLRLSGTDTISWPYRRRRAALESVFAARRLIAPWVLCPPAIDPDTVRETTEAIVGALRGSRPTVRGKEFRSGGVEEWRGGRGRRDVTGSRRRRPTRSTVCSSR